MRNFRMILALVAILSSSQVLADTATTTTTTTAPTTATSSTTANANSNMPALSDQSCEAVANACTAAGYKRGDTGNKKFWFNCMKPIVLGQAVDGVTVDAATVKACRESKSVKLSRELQEIQAAESKGN